MACLRQHCPSACKLTQNAFVQSPVPLWMAVSSVQSLSHVRLFATPWAAAFQASLSMDSYRKEEINTSPPGGWLFQEIFTRLTDFFFFFFLLYLFTSPPLCFRKEPGIQILIRWLFWDTSLQSSWSAGFPNKVIFLASTPSLLDLLACCVVSRVSLDSVTCTTLYRVFCYR